MMKLSSSSSIHYYVISSLISILRCHAFSTTPPPQTRATLLPPIGYPPVEVWPKLVVGGKEDPAMGQIEQNQIQSGKPYGKILDAGTGIYSLRWLASLLYRYNNPVMDTYSETLHFESYTAVTADENFKIACQEKAKELGVLEYGDILKGNWNDHLLESNTPNNGHRKLLLCQDEMFDTILADYLVGAVDHFSPFFQDELFTRLVQYHLKPGGIMHLTGLNPIPEQMDDENHPGNIFCRITKLRDACILLAGSRPYREHPSDWVVRNLEKSGLEILNISTFENTYTYEKIKVQIDECRSTLQFFDDDELRTVMSERIDRMDDECKDICQACPDKKFVLGYDWVITAMKREEK